MVTPKTEELNNLVDVTHKMKRKRVWIVAGRKWFTGKRRLRGALALNIGALA